MAASGSVAGHGDAVPEALVDSGLRRFLSNRAAVVGACVVALVTLIAILAPQLAPHSPYDTFRDGLTPAGSPVPPGARFLLGTDDLGRDLLSRLIFAARISLEVGLLATAVSTVVGTLLGVIAGYWGGWVDGLIMRFTDVMMAFPFLLFVIILVAVLKPSVTVIYAVIGLLGWTNVARIARSQTLSVARLPYVDAARTLGASSWRIIFTHVIPNVVASIIVFGTLRVGNYVLLEGALSYLGVGVPPPTPSWGSMIAVGQQYYQVAPWMIIFPGVMLTLTVVGFNLLGEGLNDAFNPREG